MKKRLVICLDGTWNSADSGRGETNVARLARAVSASSMDQDPRTAQLTLYLRGVGSTGTIVSRLLGGVIGDGVDENIRSAYMFIAQNYVPGDQIFVFGFSRGAFTARSLCGFIGCVGILKRWSMNRIADAWAYYRAGGDRSSEDFCRRNQGTSCHGDVQVDFLGVWDTVGALGVPTSLGELGAEYQFHNTTPSACVLRARHALAIDEHRDEFVPTFWTGENPGKLDIEQVWFAGAHSDVGGGYGPGGLADIPLVWMAEEAAKPIVGPDGKERPGLVLDWKDVLPRHLDPTAPQHESRQGLFAKDRFTPTYRRICEVDREVGRLGYLYAPSKEGEVLPTINESVHWSVWERLGAEVTLMDDEQPQSMPYEPVNLPPKGAVPTWAASPPPLPASPAARQPAPGPDLAIAP
jgi:hypothetical protein